MINNSKEKCPQRDRVCIRCGNSIGRSRQDVITFRAQANPYSKLFICCSCVEEMYKLIYGDPL